MLMLASFPLGFAMFGALHGLDLVWLHPAPMRSCLDVTIWEASLNVRLLHAYPSLFRSMQCYAYHACLCQPLTFYASLHTCLHVHAWVLLASVSSILQHNEAMDIWSKLTFVPHRHHLLFAFLFVCLLACFLISLLAMAIMLICFLPFSYALRISFFPLLVCWFFVPTFECAQMVWGHIDSFKTPFPHSSFLS